MLGPTHAAITRLVCERSGISGGDLEAACRGAVLPDEEDERHGLLTWAILHSVNQGFPQNEAGIKMAVLYTRLSLQGDYEALGCALHHLQDLCNPYHSAYGAGAVFSVLGRFTGVDRHESFEAWIEANWARIQGSVDDGIRGFSHNGTAAEVADWLAREVAGASSSVQADLDNAMQSGELAMVEGIARSVVTLATAASATLVASVLAELRARGGSCCQS